MNARPTAFFFLRCNLLAEEVREFYSKAQDGFESTQIFTVSRVSTFSTIYLFAIFMFQCSQVTRKNRMIWRNWHRKCLVAIVEGLLFMSWWWNQLSYIVKKIAWSLLQLISFTPSSQNLVKYLMRQISVCLKHTIQVASFPNCLIWFLVESNGFLMCMIKSTMFLTSNEK